MHEAIDVFPEVGEGYRLSEEQAAWLNLQRALNYYEKLRTLKRNDPARAELKRRMHTSYGRFAAKPGRIVYDQRDYLNQAEFQLSRIERKVKESGTEQMSCHLMVRLRESGEFRYRRHWLMDWLECTRDEAVSHIASVLRTGEALRA